jgi:hypothetical protein
MMTAARLSSTYLELLPIYLDSGCTPGLAEVTGEFPFFDAPGPPISNEIE